MNEIIEIEQEIKSFIDTNKEVTIANNEDLTFVAICIKGVKRLQEKVKESYDPVVDRAYQTHKEAIAARDKYLKPLQDIEKRFKNAIVVFNQKLEFEARERERIANETLAKVAEETKQKLMAKAEETKNEWEAETLKEQAQEIKPITVDVQKKVIEQEGLSIRKTWKARVINKDIIPREYLMVNEHLLNCVARDFKGKLEVPGVIFEEVSTASVRS